MFLHVVNILESGFLHCVHNAIQGKGLPIYQKNGCEKRVKSDELEAK